MIRCLPSPRIARKDTVNQTLNDLAVEYWEYVLRTEPTEALMMGDHRYDDRFEDLSREAEDDDIAARRDFASRARVVDPKTLTADEKITREVLIFLTAAQADLLEMRTAEWNVSHTMGMQAMMPVIIPQVPLLEAAHAEAMIPKLRGLAKAFEDAAVRLREGVAAGKVPMSSTAEKSAAQVDALLAQSVAQHPLGRFRAPEGWSGEAVWRTDVEKTLTATVFPALADVARHRGRSGGARRPTRRSAGGVSPEGRCRGLPEIDRLFHHHRPDRRGDPPDRARPDRPARRRVPHARLRGARHE